MIFNKDSEGGHEIALVLGMVNDDVDFSTWAPILPLGTRDLAAIIGRSAVSYLERAYNAVGGVIEERAGIAVQAQAAIETRMPPVDDFSALRPAVVLCQQAVAMFTWLKIIPTLDALHDSTGRARRLGENEKGLTALEQYKDEDNIRRLAYEATDALIEELDTILPRFWTTSPRYKMRSGLLIRSKETFDQYYTIGSHRLFLTLLPIIAEVQRSVVAPAIGGKLMPGVLADGDPALASLADMARRVTALLTIRKAVERLPVEVLPEGIVQVNQAVPVTQRLRAEKEARAAVVASLGADADGYLRAIEDEVADLLATPDTSVDPYISGPLSHTKGMSF